MSCSRNARRTAPRLTALAACLAAVFAADSAIPDAGVATQGSDARSPVPRSNAALFGSIQPRLAHGVRNRRTGASQRPAPSMAPAGTHVVTNCDDDGPGSLRQAIADAGSGSTVDLTGLTCSTITLTTGRIYINQDVLSVQGPGRDALTIDGNANDLVFEQYGSELSISDVTIANGHYLDGAGGCTWIGGNLTLTNSRVTGCQAGDGSNYASYGAGLDVIGDLTLASSIVSGNVSQAEEAVFGGGIYAGGNVYLHDDSTIDGNSALSIADLARGGGIFAQGEVHLVTSTVSGNLVSSVDGTAYGGGIHTNGGLAVIDHSTVNGNLAHSKYRWSYGGGIQAGDEFGGTPGSIELFNSTISGNTNSADCGDCFIQGGGAHAFGKIHAVDSTVRDNQTLSASGSDGVARGGGLATFTYYDSLVLVNSTVSGNSAIGGDGGYGSGYGGGIAAVGSVFDIANSTLAFNHASSLGGGATASIDVPDDARLVSSIIANNTAPTDADISNGNYSGPIVVDGEQNLVTIASADVTLPGDTLFADPVLLPLAANGGPTMTHALAACSPAVDAGGNPLALAADQRGLPYLREWGVATDIGAFELQPDPDRIFADGFELSPCPP